MSTDRWWALGAAVIIAALVGGACSSDSSPSASSRHGGKAALCATLDQLRPLVRTTTDSQFLAMLKANRSTFESLPGLAPGEMKGDAQQVADVVHKVTDTGDITPFRNPKSLANRSVANLDSFCGTPPATASVATASS